MPQLRIGHGDICYEQRGQGEDVLLIHSFPHDMRVWQTQAELLCDRYRVTIFDLPGFGQSAAAASFSIESAAELVLDLATHLGIGRFVLGGISMGGYIALAVIKKCPEKIAALMLCDTKAAADTDAARQKRTELLHLLAEKGPAAVVNQLLPAMLDTRTPAEQPAVASQLRIIMEGQSPAALAAGIAALRDRQDYSTVLPGIAVPVLLLFGQADQTTPPDTADTLSRQIASPTVVLIPRAGHISSIDQPRDVVMAVRRFLETVAF